jgi:cation transport ATPase
MGSGARPQLVKEGDFDLPMSVGAVAMSVSTIVVAANAQLLRRLKLQRAGSRWNIG